MAAPPLSVIFRQSLPLERAVLWWDDRTGTDSTSSVAHATGSDNLSQFVCWCACALQRGVMQAPLLPEHLFEAASLPSLIEMSHVGTSAS